MSIEAALDRLYAGAVQVRWLHAFSSLCRSLLAVGFIAPGLTKVLGHRFANPEDLTPETPVGAFFDVFFQAGAYYAFVGVAQVVAAVLLLFPRTAALGAVLYFPIILNIFVITAALDFGGTAVVAGLMLVACLFLICWHYPLWKGLLFPGPTALAYAAAPSRSIPAQAAWYFTALGGIGITLMMRGLLRSELLSVASLMCLGVALALCLWAAVRGWRPRSAPPAA